MMPFSLYIKEYFWSYDQKYKKKSYFLHISALNLKLTKMDITRFAMKLFISLSDKFAYQSLHHRPKKIPWYIIQLLLISNQINKIITYDISNVNINNNVSAQVTKDILINTRTGCATCFVQYFWNGCNCTQSHKPIKVRKKLQNIS